LATDGPQCKALRFARDAVAVTVEAVDVFADNTEVPVRDVGAVEVVADDRDAAPA
jgi:hypothetical protein